MLGGRALLKRRMRLQQLCPAQTGAVSSARARLLVILYATDESDLDYRRRQEQDAGRNTTLRPAQTEYRGELARSRQRRIFELYNVWPRNSSARCPCTWRKVIPVILQRSPSLSFGSLNRMRPSSCPFLVRAWQVPQPAAELRGQRRRRDLISSLRGPLPPRRQSSLPTQG